MPILLLDHEPALRLGYFVGVLVAIMVWERWAPRRRRAASRWLRWPSNLGVAALGTVLVRAGVPVTAVGVAGSAQSLGFGLLHQVEGPTWLKIAVAIVILDLAIYLQHVMFHAVPALWRLHRMHHADLDFDVTTGVRFHPLEILLSLGIKCGVVAALGAPAMAVLLFEIALNATAMFSHGNLLLPERLDRALRWVVVTPDMHRVHHSVVASETNRNFGFNLPWWDRLLGTYQDQPAAGHEGMTIGLDAFRDPRQLRLDRMLVQPFSRQGEDPPAGRAS
jgi:sterol desaturase/sphingolipid hydroxylase (fatty acid hydroxylase superfamily)